MLKYITFLMVFITLFNALAFLHSDESTEKQKDVKTTKLDEIVVTATKTKRTVADLPVEANLITAKQIADSNAQTVADVLKYTPGINMSTGEDRAGNTAYRTTLRGLGLNEGYGLVLIDGQRIKGGGMGEYGYGLNQIPPEMIERIEVVKGPSSVLYGSDALAGVINIITKPTPEKRLFSCVQGYGSQDTVMQGVTYGDKISEFGYLMSATMEKSEAAKYSGEDQYEGHHILTRFSYVPNKTHRLNLNANWDRNDWLYAEEEGLKISPVWEVELSDASKLLIKGYWSNWDFYYFSPTATQRKGDIGYHQIESQYTRYLTGQHRMTAGIESLRELIDYTLAHKTLDTRSLFLQDEWFTQGNVDMVLGIRLDSHSEFGSEVSPKASSLWRVAERTRVRASIGRSFKSPTIRQLYYTAPFKHSTYYIQSNPDLDPEYGLGYSLGVTQEISKKLTASLGLFRNDVKDMVLEYDTGQTYSGKPLRTYKNVSEAYTQGVEISLGLQLIASLSSELAYTFMDTEDESTGKELTYRPIHTAGWQLNYKNQPYGFNINWGLRYVSPMFKDTANSIDTDGYTEAEAKFIKSISESTQVSLEIDNLFNTDYGDPSVERTGRTIMSKITVRF